MTLPGLNKDDETYSSCICPEARTGTHCELLIEDAGSSSSSTSSSSQGGGDGAMTTTSLVLVLLFVGLSVLGVALGGRWMCRRFGDGVPSSSLDANKKKYASHDVEMTEGDGISKTTSSSDDVPGVERTKSEDTADSSVGPDTDWMETGGAMTELSINSAYGTTVHPSWHEIMEHQADTLEDSYEHKEAVTSGEFA